MTDNDVMTYEEAALFLGCDHHWVRMLTSRGTFEIAYREEVKPNVLKVYINADQVRKYAEARRRRTRVSYQLTDEEAVQMDLYLNSIRRNNG